MLTMGAFNALLKTLEEPPSHVIFVLATTDPHKIPLTILSRCQRFDFKKISNNDIVKRLNTIVKKESLNVEDGALLEIARLSDGGMRDSISLLDQVISYSDNNITIQDIHDINGTVSQMDLKDLIQNILKKEIVLIFKKIDFYDEKGKNLIKVTQEILLFLRNLLLYQIVPEYFTDKNIDVSPYQMLSSEIEKNELIQILDKMNDAILKMKLSDNPKMIFELTIIGMLNVDKDVSSEVTIVDSSSQNVSNEKANVYLSNPELQEELHKVIDVRINNTLAAFQRKKLLEVRNNIENVRSFILDEEYSSVASLILDGEIKAASDENIIIVYDKKWMQDSFNENLLLIEKLFQKIYNKKYKLIATNKEDWDKIKKDFNEKKKIYEKKEETFDLKKIFSMESEKLEIENVFGDIIEYS